MSKTRNNILLQNIPDQRHTELQNIASHLGVSIRLTVRNNLHLITQAFPKEYREKPLDKKK